MITNFKLYEIIKKSPTKKALARDYKIGDYVICECKTSFTFPELPELNEFTLNNIGQIIDILDIRRRSDIYVVQFDYIPEILRPGFQIKYNKADINKKYENSITFNREDIKYLSDDKSDLETLISANKFNL